MKRFIFVISIFITLNLSAEVFFTDNMIRSHLENYNEEEISLIEKDLSVVRSVCFDKEKKEGIPFYLATAGGPGSRKTTILERFLSTHPEYQSGIYLDPDPRTLRFMAHTYYAQSLNSHVISSLNDYDQVIQNAYQKWRGGSNYIALSLLEEAFTNELCVIHGTTSTGRHIPEFLANVKEKGYEIVLILCSCPDDLRYEAVNYRNQVVRFYQSSPEDAVAKGLLFPQRMESYFTYADRIYFFWSNNLTTEEKLCGEWSKGKFTLYDQEAMDRFVNKYEADRATLMKERNSLKPFTSFIPKY